MYDQLLELEVKFEDWFLLKDFDLASILLLGLGGISKEILKMLACLPFNSLLVVVFLINVLLNCNKIYCLKDLKFTEYLWLFYLLTDIAW